MDPVHGEISRAMRNRGLEIYISGEGDGSIPDDLDLKVLLHSLGLVGDSVCDTLLALHRETQSAFVGKVLDFYASAGFYSCGNSRDTLLLVQEFFSVHRHYHKNVDVPGISFPLTAGLGEAQELV